VNWIRKPRVRQFQHFETGSVRLAVSARSEDEHGQRHSWGVATSIPRELREDVMDMHGADGVRRLYAEAKAALLHELEPVPISRWERGKGEMFHVLPIFELLPDVREQFYAPLATVRPATEVVQ
jgi:hypothetical protein